MKNNSLKGILLCLCVSDCLLPTLTIAQTKTEYKNLADAMAATRKLTGKSGPRGVDWINNGDQYSFNTKGGISAKDPATLKEDIIFNDADLKFPGTDTSFKYDEFQWSHDST